MAGPNDRRLHRDGTSGPAGQLRLVADGGDLPVRRPIAVLYVEDDEADVFLLRRQIGHLANFSVDLVTVPTLGDARAALDARRFDIILCDFWLGCETTIGLIDELGATPRPTPVVLVSSLENDDIELIGRRAGAAGFVSKQDLSAVALDRIFTTLMPARRPEAAALDGLGTWLHEMMRSLDRAKALSGTGGPLIGETAVAIAEVVTHSAEIRGEILDKLAELSGSWRDLPAAPARFDALAYVVDAVTDLRRRAGPGVAVAFLEPAMAIEIDGHPTLFTDVVHGFFAEAGEAVDRGLGVAIGLKVTDGCLVAEIRADGGPVRAVAEPAPRTAAAAETRRLLVETLARSCGGAARFGDSGAGAGLIGRLAVPLRRR